MNFWKHFKTITRHKIFVMQGCFKVGLYRQGLTHDLSKYSPTEFRVGMKYYQGTRSPNAAERDANGYSLAWMHHKGRNRHHFEYWNDLIPGTKTYGPVPMPEKYLVEMVMDRIAACKTYQGKNYSQKQPFAYFMTARESGVIHPETTRKLHFLLKMLADEGEEKTFRFIREVVLAGKPYAEEPENEPM